MMDLIKEALKLIRKLLGSRPSKEIAKVVKIFDAMHKVIEDTDVQRIMVCKAHNGGSFIKPNTLLYVSAIYEDYTAPFGSVKDTYQKIEVDEEYIRTLVSLCQQKELKIRTSEMKPCLQKQIYEGTGIKYSEMYFLGQDRKNLYFCSLASVREGGWGLSPRQNLLIKLAISQIKNNIH